MSSIQSIREQIDALDDELLALLNKRIALAQEIGAIKTQEQGELSSVYRPEREAQVLRRLKQSDKGQLSDPQIEVLFREIMSISRGAEADISVGVLGPEGTFSEIAAKKQFGASVNMAHFSRIDEVFSAIEHRSVSYGVVPIENSTEGGISTTADCLLETQCKISGEVYLQIHQYLLSTATDLGAVKKVYSHAQSLAQCRRWLIHHLPHAQLISVASNALAANKAASEDDAAAIAAEVAAEQYQLNVLARNIEDEPNNTTRFLVLSNEEIAASGDDKTSLLVSCANQPGGLFGLLKPLNEHNISMLRIESRPARSKRWDYLFFIDIEGHCTDPDVANALEDLKKQAQLFRLLGSYPRAA